MDTIPVSFLLLSETTMKLKPTINAIAMGFACLGLASCSIFNGRADSQSIQYSYTVDKAKLPALVQVYDLGGNTVIQFENADKLGIKVTDPRGIAVPFNQVGENIVFNGIQSRLTVQTNKGTAVVVNRAIPDSALPAGTPDTETMLKAQLTEKLREEVASIRQELARLQLQLAEEKKKQTVLADAYKVTVTFKNNSTAFNPSPDEEQKLMAAAFKANEISIKGYTDSSIANKPAAQLAERRAMEAQKYLMSKGVSESIIHTEFSSSGGFVADNATEAGKAKNRRVEIVLTPQG